MHKTFPRNAVSTMAFTVSELLVVIGILVVLAVLAIPLAGRSSAIAKSVHCASNLRQIGVYFQHYAIENNGLLNFHRYDATAVATTVRWSDYLVKAGYLNKRIKGREDIMSCPVRFPKDSTTTGYVYGGVGLVEPGDMHSVRIENAVSSRGIRMRTIEEPSKYWLLADTWSVNSQAQMYIVHMNSTTTTLVHLRHSGRANILFADGHVKGMTLEETIQLPINPIHHAYDEEIRKVSR